MCAFACLQNEVFISLELDSYFALLILILYYPYTMEYLWCSQSTMYSMIMQTTNSMTVITVSIICKLTLPVWWYVGWKQKNQFWKIAVSDKWGSKEVIIIFKSGKCQFQIIKWWSTIPKGSLQINLMLALRDIYSIIKSYTLCSQITGCQEGQL